jgi:hypothetical protein
MKIVIPDDFFGTCSACLGTSPKEATLKVWVPFETPLPATNRFPEVNGIWCYVCSDCETAATA